MANAQPPSIDCATNEQLCLVYGRMVNARIQVRTSLPRPIEEIIASIAGLTWVGRKSVNIPHDVMEDAEILICSPNAPVNEALIDKLGPSLKLIASYSVGVDHVDLKVAEARGIAVTNTPNVLTDTTADLAIMLTLMALRGVRLAEEDLRQGRWKGWRPDAIYGSDPNGKVFGIIGYGRIGQATARRALAFGLQPVFFDRKKSGMIDEVSEAEPDWLRFLGRADIVSLHAPSTAETRKLIDHAAIDEMRPGAILINTARGDLVDDDSVIEALHTNQLGGIGFDVFDGEPKINQKYLDAPNATLLPHIGSSTYETRMAMGRMVIANIDAFLAGKVLPNPVF